MAAAGLSAEEQAELEQAVDAEYDAFITMMAEKMAAMDDEQEGSAETRASGTANAGGFGAAGVAGGEEELPEELRGGAVAEQALQQLLGMGESELEALLERELEALGGLGPEGIDELMKK
jgi:hypothetical protein